MYAMLRTQLHIQQTQEMPDLSGGSHCAFAATARETLLNRDRRRNAVNRIDFGTARRLHNASRIGVQAFQITPLAFVEQYVKRQCGFARSADAGDHVELAARNVHAQVFQIVFFGVDDAYVVVQHLAQVLGRGFGGHSSCAW